jgi:tetratricopeptide (TPR) repeat protein
VARLVALVTLAVAVLAGVRAQGARADEDLEALIAAPVDEVANLAEAAMVRHPADGHLAAVAAMRLVPRPASVMWVERALQLAPRDLVAHHAAARVLIAAGELDQAAGEIRELLELSPPRDVADLLEEASLNFDDQLPSAVPAPLRIHLMARLAAHQRWHQLDLIGRAALADTPDDVDVLRRLLDGALQTKQRESIQWAERLAAVSQSASDGSLVAMAFLAAGRADDAERLLRAALARAVETSDKVALHGALARVEDALGNFSQAALERQRATQLLRH